MMEIKGALPQSYWVIEQNEITLTEGGVIDESLVTIYANGQELATVMCSPIDQEAMALGFLYNEAVIESLDEVGHIQANVARTIVDIFLNTSDFAPPRRMILTSGCGGGITWQYLSEAYPPLETNFQTTTAVIFDRMRDLQSAATLYQAVRGVHTALLGNVAGALVSAEDVGRHNAVDKIAGKALQAGIATQDCILLTSGRISSEMLGKARRMGIPIVVSRTAPTSISVRLAQAWNMCIVGYVRRGGMRVYTHPQRLGIDARNHSVE